MMELLRFVLNDALRSVVTYVLIGSVIVGFFQNRVSVDFLYGLATGAFTWWFARDQAKAAIKESVDLLKSPPPTTGPTKEEIKP